MTTVICVTSQKGGVAKTTTAVSVAHGLARAGEKVLLADFDPQGHASIALGNDPNPGVYRFFVDGEDDVCLSANRERLLLLPGNSRTRTADSVLRAESSAAQMIERFGLLARSGFTHIVIDTPAGGLFQEVAVRMADDLIIPVRCEALGLDGVAATVKLAEKIGNPAQILILPTMFDRRLTEHRINLDALRKAYRACVVEPVPVRVAVAEASACGRTVWEMSGDAIADAQAAYTALLEKLR